MFFLNQDIDKNDKINIKYPDLSLINLYIHNDLNLINQNIFVPIHNSKKELIIMVGYPGSGKTYYTKKFIQPAKYIYINQDELKTSAKCVKELKKNLELNNNVVIDNLNFTKNTRAKYIENAKKYNYDVRCIVLKTSKELSKHNMMHRYYNSDGKYSIIPEIVYNNYRCNYELPEINEGIHKIEFVDFNTLDNDKYSNYYNYYY
jgi:bifunctional polynucleotide phosphatase/kinase